MEQTGRTHHRQISLAPKQLYKGAVRCVTYICFVLCGSADARYLYSEGWTESSRESRDTFSNVSRYVARDRDCGPPNWASMEDAKCCVLTQPI